MIVQVEILKDGHGMELAMTQKVEAFCYMLGKTFLQT